MSGNDYETKKADMWRLYGSCGLCQQGKWFVKRIEIKVPTGFVISPSHFCKKCAIIVRNKLTPPNEENA